MREGYKKTEVGIIPENWETVSLSDICEINPKKDILENDDEVAFLPMEQVSNSGRIIKINTKKYEDVSKGYTPFKNKDVLLAKITPCFENGKRALVENLQYKMGFGSTEFHVLRSLEERVIPQYIYYCIDTHRFKELAERNMTGSAGQKRVPTTFLKDYKLSIPPLKEQEKIAKILSTVDSQIDNAEKLIEKTKELKKGLMQKLLTKGIGHSEFKKTEIGEIPVDWEVKRLDELTNRITDGSHSSPIAVDNSDYKICTVANMKKNILDISKATNISREDYDKLINNGCYAENGDVLLSKDGTIGKTMLYSQEHQKIVLLSSIAILKPMKEKLIGEYLNQYLQDSRTLTRIVNTKTGSAIKRIVLRDINSLKIVVPKLEEQEKIAKILLSVDNEIEQYENRKQKLEELKKGLMQQLLTGKIRTI